MHYAQMMHILKYSRCVNCNLQPLIQCQLLYIFFDMKHVVEGALLYMLEHNIYVRYFRNHAH